MTQSLGSLNAFQQVYGTVYLLISLKNFLKVINLIVAKDMINKKEISSYL
jgi:hypothetical protein